MIIKSQLTGSFFARSRLCYARHFVTASVLFRFSENVLTWKIANVLVNYSRFIYPAKVDDCQEFRLDDHHLNLNVQVNIFSLKLYISIML